MTSPRLLVAIVDDDESVRRAFMRFLSSAGLAVVSFRDGDDFLLSSCRQQPDCVVLDLHLSGTDGFGGQAQAGSRNSGLPVIAVTGSDTPEARQRVMRAGAAAYLAKPFDRQVLLDAVTVAVGGRARPAAK